MIKFEEDIKEESIYLLAKSIVLAARTAPKDRGMDNLSIAIATNETISAIADKMKRLSKELSMPFFERDADAIIDSQSLILICSAFGFKLRLLRIPFLFI